ncbi:hypothetical protein KCV26_08415 [Petrimonas sulfuriphila]|uniref:hypothetical protein n=1 Tax=Petrimonas sulfuriphila TaxID=285070 RepID=UPI00325691AE
MLVLAGLLKSQDDETVLLAKDALSTYKGDISYTLASVFNESGDVGKKSYPTAYCQPENGKSV